VKRCAYCDQVIVGEAKEIAAESASGARPTAYWHPTVEGCVKAEEQNTGTSSPLRRLLSGI
jgi:hypothetical protein